MTPAELVSTFVVAYLVASVVFARLFDRMVDDVEFGVVDLAWPPHAFIAVGMVLVARSFRSSVEDTLDEIDEDLAGDE